MTRKAIGIYSAQISSNYALALLDYMRERAVDTDAFLRELKLSEADLGGEHGQMPMATFLMLMEEAAKYLGDPNLGLHYYEGMDFRRHGVFGYALLNSKNLGDALALGNRYYCLFQQDTEMRLERYGDRVSLTYIITAKNLPHSRQDAEMTTMSLMSLVRQMVDPNWRPDEVHFKHDAPADLSEHKRLLCDKLEFNAPYNRLYFAADILDVPFQNADPQLNLSLTSTLNQLLELRQLPSENDWLKSIQDHIIDALSEGVPPIEEIAERLHMSQRTLQRKLSQQDLTYKELVEYVRRELAINHLKASDIAVQDIAFLLGYSDLSTFNRAFKRWTGETPLEFRSNRRPRT
ncbi:HTH-type transcriptional regulator VirS [Microbulbifer aggregans]|uniref:HTH-type transcriptional regulator VirS n=1 Tax=Microbulbifer aggregans TaxID=1769779 RepID=A0A1C9W4E4_9GAMM|nr:AraC family transcriptional regulator [Microbulbifer aggregans]AOS96000.1 HTH-type transcriptional regulator VirS [Microbulbifer aggregans]